MLDAWPSKVKVHASRVDAVSWMAEHRLRVLVACEFSGRVRDAFAARGWDAWSCDLLPSETPSLRHYQDDVLEVFRDSAPGYWDLIIAFPPCTDLSLAGAVWWKAKQADGRQQRAAEFFMAMVSAPAACVAVENPRGVMSRLYRPPDEVVEPWWFGEPLAKKTCLWLKELPLLVKDRPVAPRGRVATGGGSWRTDIAAGRGGMNFHEDGEGRRNRAKVRGRTSAALARAMADQWGSWLEKRMLPSWSLTTGT